MQDVQLLLYPFIACLYDPIVFLTWTQAFPNFKRFAALQKLNQRIYGAELSLWSIILLEDIAYQVPGQWIASHCLKYCYDSIPDVKDGICQPTNVAQQIKWSINLSLMLHCLSVEVKFDLSQRLFGQYLLTLYLLRCCGEIFHWTSENTKAGEFVVCFKGVRCYDN